MSRKKTENFNFEAALTELNGLVEKMEQGGLPLEESLQHFEKGVVLTRQCQQALKEAEQKVQILLAKNGNLNLENYHSEEDE